MAGTTAQHFGTQYGFAFCKKEVYSRGNRGRNPEGKIGKAPAQRFLIQKVPETNCIVPMIPQHYLVVIPPRKGTI